MMCIRHGENIPVNNVMGYSDELPRSNGDAGEAARREPGADLGESEA